jgi:hypothetical protein
MCCRNSDSLSVVPAANRTRLAGLQAEAAAGQKRTSPGSWPLAGLDPSAVGRISPIRRGPGFGDSVLAKKIAGLEGNRNLVEIDEMSKSIVSFTESAKQVIEDVCPDAAGCEAADWLCRSTEGVRW